jgi:8-oxo-dGTP diphosphatase
VAGSLIVAGVFNNTQEKQMSDPSGKLSSKDGADMTEAEFLAAYKANDYPKPSVTVDLVIFTVLDTDLKVLLIKRGGHPFRGCWALPGGFVNVGDGVKEQGEDLEAAAHRELAEETGLPKGSCYLEQLYTFGKAGRDPRTRVISVAYFALVRPTLAPIVTAGDDAAAAQWFSVQAILERGSSEAESKVLEHDGLFSLSRNGLAFDHDVILDTAIKRLRGRIDYSPIAFDLVPETFTVAELRSVYEAVKGAAYDPKTFHRKFRRMLADGILVTAPGKRGGTGRPSAVYRFKR